MSRKQNDGSLEDILLDIFFENPGKAYHIPDLLKILHLKSSHSNTLKRILRKLVKQKAVIKFKGKRYTAGHRMHIRSGKYEAGKFGAGFVRSESGDLYIPAGYSLTALPGDTVRAEVFARRSGPTAEGRIIDILKRSKNEIVGTFKQSKSVPYVLPDENFVRRRIEIAENKTMSAKEEHRVAVRITYWEDEYLDPVGEVTDILGYPGDKGVNVLTIAKSFGIPIRFPDKVLRAADECKQLEGKALLKGRRDFREQEVITIDPDDSKDFDDAVSLRELADGNLEIGVYIADVTAYVNQGDHIDKEARKRGTSVYLIDKVIHMLPERLSTELCSLIPGTERPVFAVIMKCTPDTEVLDYEFCEGVIYNHKRFTYREAQDAIDGTLQSPHAWMLQNLDRFAKKLRAKRFENGSLDFFLPEVQFEMEESGFPKRIFIKELLDSNNLIEDLMLLANRLAAGQLKTFENHYRTPLPYIYRIHDVPDKDNIATFSELVNSLGCPKVRVPFGTLKWFQRVLNYFKDKPEKALVEQIALRSMMKAVYDSRNSGHFGLGFSEYSHFTSPIRRYPDLLLHRLMKLYAMKEPVSDISSLKRKVTNISKQSSEYEIRAMEAEREAVKTKKLEYMEDKIGNIYSGIITGVTSFGLFVELADILVEGLVHIKDLVDDYYLHDESGYRLTGQHSNRVYKIGDRISVQVVKVNIERRHLDLIPAY